MNSRTRSRLPDPSNLRTGAGWLIALSVLLIILGIVAIFTPTFASVTFTLVLAWLLLLNGVVRIVQSFWSGPIRGVWLNGVIGVLYAIAGLTILFNPVKGVVTVTAVLATLLIVEGSFAIINAFRVRPGGRLSWLVLLDGLITLILGIFVWNRFPSSAQWLIGLYVGISLVISGVSLLLISMASRKRPQQLP